MSAVTTTLIETTDGLSALHNDWLSLWRDMPRATPFQHPRWLTTWWNIFHPGQLHVIAAHRRAQLIGLAPLYVEPGGKLLPIGISLSDITDLLADPEYESEALDALALALAEPKSTWRTWIMPDLPHVSLAGRILLTGVRMGQRQGDRRPVLTLEGEAGLARVPAIKQRKLRMARHRTARARSSRIASVDDLPPQHWSTHLERLHTARWRSRGESGVLADGSTVAFQRAALAAMVEAGLARLYGLEIDDEIVGVYYGFHHRTRAYAYLGGFDPASSYFSPGTVLIGHAISTAAAEGARELDFLRGAERYKYEWGASDRSNKSIWVDRDPAGD